MMKPTPDELRDPKRMTGYLAGLFRENNLEVPERIWEFLILLANHAGADFKPAAIPEIPPLSDAEPELAPNVVRYVLEWIPRMAPLVRSETDLAELTIRLHTPQASEDDERDPSLYLWASFEEKTSIELEYGGRVPGVKRY